MFEIGLDTGEKEVCLGSFGHLAGELQFFGERFVDGCSGVIGKCGKLD